MYKTGPSRSQAMASAFRAAYACWRGFQNGRAGGDGCGGCGVLGVRVWGGGGVRVFVCFFVVCFVESPERLAAWRALSERRRGSGAERCCFGGASECLRRFCGAAAGVEGLAFGFCGLEFAAWFWMAVNLVGVVLHELREASASESNAPRSQGNVATLRCKRSCYRAELGEVDDAHPFWVA